MYNLIRISLLAMLLAMQVAVAAGDISREQIKGLDEQVQDIKQDVLAISTELLQLEEKLLYPSNTQVSLFVSVVRGGRVRLDSVDIRLNGRSVTHHVYTHKELEALQSGGVQRIYTGNLRAGEHQLEITLAGANGFSESATHTFTKDEGPALVEIRLFGADNNIAFKDR
jgi:hypothetical protein